MSTLAISVSFGHRKQRLGSWEVRRKNAAQAVQVRAGPEAWKMSGRFAQGRQIQGLCFADARGRGRMCVCAVKNRGHEGADVNMR
jgi:hypothetical protein